METLFDQTFFNEHQALQKTFFDFFKHHQDVDKSYQAFQELIKHYYANKKRFFPWRENITPYRIVVSEIMLQQTQTGRIAQKFDDFIEQFPSFSALAHAPFQDVLRQWKGLGYNRRALALQKIAQTVVKDYDGKLPETKELLQSLPGIGKATAGSIAAFAFNQPTIFIETNIRTVFIFFFFSNQTNILDSKIEPLIIRTIDHHNPREWYYALMDYGTMLKKTIGNISQLSAHHHKQSPFEGSERQLRGRILQELLDNPQGLTEANLIAILQKEADHVTKLVDDLCNEQLIKRNHDMLSIS